MIFIELGNQEYICKINFLFLQYLFVKLDE